MPAFVGTRRVLLSAPAEGIIRAGLVGMWIPALDDDARNLLKWSENLTVGWTATNVTVDTATTLTFLAQHSRLTQGITTLAGVSYTLRFKARRISGNTSLVLRHINSATADSTGFTITDTLALYSVTVLGRAGGGTVSFGIGDSNASGWGQVEFTEVQVNVGGLEPYVPVTDKQTLYDRSGNSFHGQLGTTPNGDTNDPAWASYGLNFGSDDNVLLPPLSAVAGNWTIQLAFRVIVSSNWALGVQTGRVGLMSDGSYYMDGAYRAPAMSTGDAVVTWALESTDKSRTYRNETLIGADKYWPAGGRAMAGNIKIGSNPENQYYLNTLVYALVIYSGAMSAVQVLRNVRAIQTMVRRWGVVI